MQVEADCKSSNSSHCRAMCCSAAPSSGADDSPRQADLPYPMSAWTWEQQQADWMKVPSGQAGLGLQVPVMYAQHKSQSKSH